MWHAFIRFIERFRRAGARRPATPAVIRHVPDPASPDRAVHIRALVERLYDDDAARAEAGEALRRLYLTVVEVDHLLPALHDEQPAVRAAAAGVLAGINLDTAAANRTALLDAAARDTDAQVRRAVLEGIAGLPTWLQAYLRRDRQLAQLMGDPDPAIQRRARDLLDALNRFEAEERRTSFC